MFISFTNEGVVRAVMFDTDKSKFESFFESLSKKYTLVEKEIPFVGNKGAKFQADNCLIILDAPHMSFNMSVNYLTAEYLDYLKKDIKQTEQNKQQMQDDVL